MFKCECGKKFEDKEEAKEHVVQAHSADVDEKLEDYIGDAIDDVYDDLITEK